jgi:molybdopterin converting factor small subunit
MIRVLFFGELKNLSHCSEWSVDARDSEELLQKVLGNWPELNRMTFVLSVNKKIAHNRVDLNAGDEVALLPPFSGG